MNLCLAYPTLTSADQSLIDEFRRLHDQAYVDVVDVHWTMLFPSSCDGFSEDQLAAHIERIAARHQPIRFVSRYALVYDDDSSDDYYIFLVPDEGFSQISLLHDDLYSDFMRPSLRLDIPFIPHMGIATSKDKDHLYELATEWNRNGHVVEGTLDTLTLSSYDGERVTDIRKTRLGS